MTSIRSLSEAKLKLLQSYLHADVARTSAPSRIGKRPVRWQAPLSAYQDELVSRETNTTGIAPLYNECVTLRMEGPLRVDLLERSLTHIIRRHEIWRTSYETIDGRNLQVVHPAPDAITLPVTDLRSLNKADREKQINEQIGELARKPFDFSAGPLLRMQLIRTSEAEHLLYLIAHLSIVDGVSVYQVLPSELATTYQAYSSNQQPQLPELPVQFGDYAHWQRESEDHEQLTRQLSYWRNQVSSVPSFNWPTGNSGGQNHTFRGEIRPFTLSARTSNALRSFSRRERATLFVTLLASYAALLHSYSHQDDIVVGTPSPAGRKLSQVQKLLGYFLNPVPLCFSFRENPSFRDLLHQAQKLTLEAISNDDLPLDVLKRELGITRPLFTMAISLQPSTPPLSLKWTVTSMDVNSGGSPWDLYLAFIDRPEGIIGRAQYNPDLFTSETIAHVLHDYENLLRAVLTDPLIRASEAGANASQARASS